MDRNRKRHRSWHQSLAHWLFPGDASWQRRKKLKTLLLALLIGLLLGVIIMAFVWLKEY